MVRNNQVILLSIISAFLIESAEVFATDYNAIAAQIKTSANLESNFTESKAQSNIPNYQGANAPQTAYYDNPSAMQDQSQLASQNSIAGQISRNAFNNKGDYNLSYLPKDNVSSSNPNIAEIIRFFTGSYSDCKQSSVQNSPINITNICDQYYQSAENTCQVTRKIEFDNTYTYSCTKDLTYTSKTCTQNLNITVNIGDLTDANFSGPWQIACGGFYMNGCTPSKNPSNWFSLFTYIPNNLAIGSKIYLYANDTFDYSNPLGLYTVVGLNKGQCYFCNASACLCGGGSITTIPNIDIHSRNAWTYKLKISEPAPSIISSWEEVCK